MEITKPCLNFDLAVVEVTHPPILDKLEDLQNFLTRICNFPRTSNYNIIKGRAISMSSVVLPNEPKVLQIQIEQH